jgi:aminoglycoside 6'-N-acetyltransferase
MPASDVALTTRRLVLRRFRADDGSALAAYRSDPVVARYQSWTAPVAEAEAADLVDAFAAGDTREPGWFQYAVERTCDHILIGDVGVLLHDNLRQADIGFTIAAAEQGRGYATEALHRLVAHLFTDRGLHKISAGCDARNTASAALLRRLGFHQEGRLRAHTWIKGEWTDDLLFGLLAADRLAQVGPNGEENDNGRDDSRRLVRHPALAALFHQARRAPRDRVDRPHPGHRGTGCPAA